MKKIILLLLSLTLLACSVCAFAATEPKSKTIEDTITYADETISVKIDRWCYKFNNTACRFFVATVEVADPAQLQTAFAGEEYSKKNAESTKAIGERHGAVLAINGDYYNYKDNISLIIRNGELFRDKDSTRDHLLVYADGTFKGIPGEEFVSGMGEQYLAEGVVQTFTFGPLLVMNGEETELPKKYVINTKDTVREPRTGIGQVDATHYVVIVADGRRDGWSDKGMTLQEMQKVFIENGCVTAYNLDGGGSATMVLNGEQINKTSGSRERDVSDIVYFGK